MLNTGTQAVTVTRKNLQFDSPTGCQVILALFTKHTVLKMICFINELFCKHNRVKLKETCRFSYLTGLIQVFVHQSAVVRIFLGPVSFHQSFLVAVPVLQTRVCLVNVSFEC